MYTYHTKNFTSTFIEDIGTWLNSFYDPEKTNSEQNVEVISQLPIMQTTGSVTSLQSVLVTIKVFKSK